MFIHLYMWRSYLYYNMIYATMQANVEEPAANLTTREVEVIILHRIDVRRPEFRGVSTMFLGPLLKI